MRRMFVLGGASAGVEAALAGIEDGAQVTLLESSQELPKPKGAWHSLPRS